MLDVCITVFIDQQSFPKHLLIYCGVKLKKDWGFFYEKK